MHTFAASRIMHTISSPPFAPLPPGLLKIASNAAHAHPAKGSTKVWKEASQRVAALPDEVE